MDALQVVLVAVAVAGVAACGWLMAARGRLLARAAELRAAGDALARERDALAREAAELRARGEDLLARHGALEKQVVALERDREAQAAAHAAELEHQSRLNRQQLEAVERREREQKAFVERRDGEMAERFRSIAATITGDAGKQLLALAEQNFQKQHQAGAAALEQRQKLIEEALKPIATTIREIEKGWTSGSARLEEQIKTVAAAGDGLREETGKLAKALRRPEVRGRYGEIQLERVVELAGMKSYCDFAVQASVRDDAGDLLRPDLIVRLPNNRHIAVDAKAPIEKYIDALEAATPEAAEALLTRFADDVAAQAEKLAKKRYWKNYEGSPDFVVMFVPGDQFVDAALRHRSDLLEVAAQQRVLLASPSTLIALLRAVAVGWQENQVSEQARELIRVARELQERFAIAFGKLGDVGKSLDSAVRSYNEFAGSYENRLAATMRKLDGVRLEGTKPLPELKPIEAQARTLPMIEANDVMGDAAGG